MRYPLLFSFQPISLQSPSIPRGGVTTPRGGVTGHTQRRHFKSRGLPWGSLSRYIPTRDLFWRFSVYRKYPLCDAASSNITTPSRYFYERTPFRRIQNKETQNGVIVFLKRDHKAREAERDVYLTLMSFVGPPAIAVSFFFLSFASILFEKKGSTSYCR